ncbi:scavenger receptor class B member 1 [Apis mellifera caucasica]|uniref:Scavenger receptor class B member 1 n=1 Tax=Apis mellifera TaxID=7460 RepID=A0A7M7MW32_APIME|nr:scavenger receptor class B member 1 [Apis mellifera]XP_026301704.1 scavenger receptor class B member 1 [Apis mellifera]KAG6796146.1 scavenger receptor class B member 1 [Apis mellifera caucasica]KAG9427868.1 scavenger receptor class B member 1 [Apis mellifera carnica]|eukprot:XP_026301703.1 scavenger receptor class B member 1 [Apis mellifera]
MRVHRGICAKLQGGFLKRWWAAVAVGALMIIAAAILAAVFPKLVDVLMNREIALRDGGRTFNWWRKPPVTPRLNVYIYNVTNADEFLNDGEKPALVELGPYVYLQQWEKVELKFNDNDTLTYKMKKVYNFAPELSAGSEEDLVVVPNVPMLSATSQSKYAARFLRLAMASIMDILRIKPFVEVSIGQLLWGYEDPLLKLAKDVVPKEQKLPYDQFGLLYGKNGTMPDLFTIYTGQEDIGKYGILDNYNGKRNLGHWTTSECDSIAGTDGSIFPPRITKDTVLKIFDKDLCRALPLVFKEEVITPGRIPGYRFVPAKDAFASPSRLESQQCFCPAGPPCAPEGTFNVSLCQYDSPVLLSFPHFYLGDPTLREAVTGISPPVERDHQFYLDVLPMMGTALRAKARIQINLAVSQVRDIKQVASFPDIVFPIIWFEDGIDELPEEMRNLMKMAVDVPPIARAAVSGTLAAIGAIVLIGALFFLVRAAKRQEKLHLSNPLPSNATASKTGQLNPAFQNPSDSK